MVFFATFAEKRFINVNESVIGFFVKIKSVVEFLIQFFRQNFLKNFLKSAFINQNGTMWAPLA